MDDTGFSMPQKDFSRWRSYGAEELLQLSLECAIGEGVAEPDYVAAHVWLNFAVGLGSEEARQRRAELAIEMTKEEIARAQKIARAVAEDFNRKSN